MPVLYVLRHAKSSWDDSDLEDHERPLAPRGERAVKRLARHFSDTGLAPDLVLCSTAVRARQTLEGVFEGGPGDPDVVIEPRLYGAGVDDVLGLLNAVEPGVESVLIVGHNPTFEEVVLTLAGTGTDLDRVRQKFPTGALATLEFDGSWNDLAPGSARLSAFVVPKDLS
jgi:phosphohistidine phosphatase